MFKFIATLAVATVVALMGGHGFFHKRPATPVDTASSAIVRIVGKTEVMTFFGPQEGEYVCSGFQIAPHRILTDEHCVGKEMTADGKPVKVLAADEYFDLALLETELVKPVSLSFRDVPVERFEPLKGIGYAYGWTRLTVLDVKPFLIDYKVDPKSPPGLIVQGQYIGGMSGGPVIDKDGQVVGIIQRARDNTGYGVGITIIKAFLVGEDLVGSFHASQTLSEPANLLQLPFIK